MQLCLSATPCCALLDEQAATVVDLCRDVREMVYQFDDLEQRRARIAVLAGRGQQLARDLVLASREAFMLPLDKQDLAELANGLADVGDQAAAAAEGLALYRSPTIEPAVRQLSNPHYS